MSHHTSLSVNDAAPVTPGRQGRRAFRRATNTGAAEQIISINPSLQTQTVNNTMNTVHANDATSSPHDCRTDYSRHARRGKRGGTFEWSNASLNCVRGCIHDCPYCYRGHYMTVRRDLMDDWTTEQPDKIKFVIPADFDRDRHRIMFPTAHDITPAMLDHCLEALRQALVVRGLRVLIVSKPHMECITAICERFKDYKDQILFRFTIGSDDDAILKAWEPNAPCLAERMACLRYAFEQGFATSVSCEPMLDPPNIERHVAMLAPFVTDAVWVGKAKGLHARMRMTRIEQVLMMATLEEQQSDDNIKAIYERLKGNPKVKWKETIKEVVGLKLPTEAGQDQ